MQYHFKDRIPRKTIKIINKFFKERGYDLKCIASFKTESGTFSSHYELWYKNLLIARSNGKGITPQLSRASGCAEMYERFCNYNNVNIFNPIFLNHYKEINPGIIGTDHILNDPRYEKFCQTVFEPWNTCKEDLYNLVTNNEPYLLQFTNVLTQERKNYDPRIIIMMNNCSGMSAGNSFEEAFCQGFSEILERYAESRILNHDIEHFQEIDQTSITSPTLKKILKNISNLNMVVNIYDMSAELSLPVIYTTLTDKINHCVIYNIASFPKLEIAIERTLTELWQGIMSFDNREFIQVPTKYKDSLVEEQCKAWVNANKHDRIAYVDEFILAEKISYKKAEKHYNCSRTLSNFDFYMHLIKENNFDVFVRNNSISNSMYAIHIYTPSIDIPQVLYKQKINSQRFNFVTNVIKKLSEFYMCGISGDLIQLNLNANNISVAEYSLIGIILFDSFLHLMGNNSDIIYNDENYHNIYFNLKQLDPYELHKNKNSIFYDNLKKYALLIKYIESSGYTIAELKAFFARINLPITDEDIQNYNNNVYLMQRIYFIPLNKLISSKEFDEYIKTYELPKD